MARGPRPTRGDGDGSALPRVDRDAATASVQAGGKRKAAPPPRGLVVVHDGAIAHRAFPIATRATLGRGAEADLQLDGAAVSRLHAVVTAGADGLTIEDRQSSHGVFVNGERLGEPRRLRAGDVVRLGTSLLVVVDDAAGHQRVGSPGELSAAGGTALAGTLSARRAIEFAERFAPASLAVLVLGATGTGKELVARLIHEKSGRRGALVAVNCAALPEALAESALFGHKRGAFSGATENHRGHFVAADGGTLFLDEVGDLSSDVQAKLLRALETKEVTPVGSSDAVRVDVRIVAATCQDLGAAVRAGGFREDLYHRLHGVSLWMPPLAERNEEIGVLVECFLAALDLGCRATTWEAMEALLLHRWPGNVRQLRQVLHAAAIRAVARGAAAIDRADLELAEPGGPRTSEPPAAAPTVERLVAAMVRHKGNVSRAARELGAHRAQIYRVLEEHGLTSEQFR